MSLKKKWPELPPFQSLAIGNRVGSVGWKGGWTFWILGIAAAIGFDPG
jgi:hypothetical protein